MGDPEIRRGRRWARSEVAVIVAGLVLGGLPVGCLEHSSALEDGTVSTECATCHGDPLRSGDALRRAAPPIDLNGSTDPREPGVGAHAIHLEASSTHAAVACDACHVVPNRTEAPGHLDHAPPAIVAFGSIARETGLTPSYDPVSHTCRDTYCHRAANPMWTEPRSPEKTCGTCHALPPPVPHPQVSDCSLCHGAVIAADNRTILDPALHVNGIVEVVVPTSCTACHGEGTDPSPAPGQPGAGAHRVHLRVSTMARAVPCGECHRVPKTVLEPGHLDTGLPPSVVFSGAARSGGGVPMFENGSCRDTECHGVAFKDGNPSGGTHTAPSWTVVGASQDTCGTCHGLPPPAPHPYGNLNPRCSACHEDIADDNRSFTHPEFHVDGVVTFTVAK